MFNRALVTKKIPLSTLQAMYEMHSPMYVSPHDMVRDRKVLSPAGVEFLRGHDAYSGIQNLVDKHYCLCHDVVSGDHDFELYEMTRRDAVSIYKHNFPVPTIVHHVQALEHKAKKIQAITSQVVLTSNNLLKYARSVSHLLHVRQVAADFESRMTPDLWNAMVGLLRIVRRPSDCSHILDILNKFMADVCSVLTHIPLEIMSNIFEDDDEDPVIGQYDDAINWLQRVFTHRPDLLNTEDKCYHHVFINDFIMHRRQAPCVGYTMEYMDSARDPTMLKFADEVSVEKSRSDKKQFWVQSGASHLLVVNTHGDQMVVRKSGLPIVIHADKFYLRPHTICTIRVTQPDYSLGFAVVNSEPLLCFPLL